MKNILLLTGLLCHGISFSQNSEAIAIQQWQSAHPSILLISQARYDAMSKEAKELIGENYILFSGEIKLDDLRAFDNQTAQKDMQVKPDADPELSPSESQFIKDWLGAHPDIEIVKQSKFQILGPRRKEWCNNPDNRVLVLSGETITRTDIENSNF